VPGSKVRPQHVEEQSAEDDESGSGLGRLLAFSDSVFAVSITLLVLPLEYSQWPDPVGREPCLERTASPDPRRRPQFCDRWKFLAGTTGYSSR
jgi:hypothetical protein